MRGKAKPAKKVVKRERLFAETFEHGRMGWFFMFVNRGYQLFAIVKRFSFKIMWTGSCIGFMFIMPALFEMMSEQEAVLDKI